METLKNHHAQQEIHIEKATGISHSGVFEGFLHMYLFFSPQQTNKKENKNTTNTIYVFIL